LLLEQLQKEVGASTMVGFIRSAILGKGYGDHFEHMHNQILRINGTTQPNLEELVTSLFGTGKLE